MKSDASAEAEFSYVGEELELFSHAQNWKRYWVGQIAPYLGANVLEVGAGIGTNTPLLATRRQSRWVCLEPDPQLARALTAKVDALADRPGRVEVIIGDVGSLPTEPAFDTILYIDVLEHIENDREELQRAYRLLAPGGALVVLSPAHPFLFTVFDAGLGHFRRYTRATLRAAGPAGVRPTRLFYLDAVGFFASLANRLLLKQKLPTRAQILFWDRYLVRASLLVDPLLGYNFGKTVIGVWTKPAVVEAV